MKKFEITPDFIKLTLAETFLHGYFYNPEHFDAVLNYIVSKIPAKPHVVSLQYHELIHIINNIIGPYDKFTQPFYIQVFHLKYPKMDTYNILEILDLTLQDLHFNQ